ncbi:hypothetical protein Vretimale_8568 [Volvox reticuliferus]|uniref:Uncharacterized protein n=1 Tax=Volvox reticuliferus TaxID=1737510 RepID=A0A8J4CD71_9CHLO|nr:hypothetical protein Vretifemale_6484 [Volvox reticuliferus]GIM03949.1 hypothetical protein Vretimale_8568 [Volvox reticuliferus]
MQPLRWRISKAYAALVALFLVCPTMADMGYYTKGLKGSSIPLAEAVLIMGVTLMTLSLVILLTAFLELRGNAFYYSIANVALATLWLPVEGISIFLITQRHYPAVAFLAAGAILIAVHTALALRQLCWCWCCGATAKGSSTENPKSALLTSPGGSGDNGPQGRADSPTGSRDPSPGSCHQFNPVAGVAGSASLEGRNPFYATYGLLPGSSVFAYQIFIPGSDEQQAAGWGPQSTRNDSPGSDGANVRSSMQPLVQLQPPSTARSQQ